MKKRTIISIIAFYVFLYLMFSFALWDLNPHHWLSETRTFLCLLCCGVTFAGISNDYVYKPFN